jgi:hypothetical protein
LRTGNVDQAISGYGKVSVKYAVRLTEPLRDSIHELLWDNTSSKRSEGIDRLLAEQGIPKSPLKEALREQDRLGAAIQGNTESRDRKNGEAQTLPLRSVDQLTAASKAL